MGERVARFVGEKCGTVFYPPYVAIGTELDGEITGGMVFNCFTGPDIEMSVAAGPRGFNREFYRFVHSYIFGTLGCERVSITTENPKIVRLAERFGAQIEGMKRNGFGRGRDAYLLGILEREWVYR